MRSRRIGNQGEKGLWRQKIRHLTIIRFVIPEGNKYDSIYTEGFKFPWKRFSFFLKAI